MFNISLVLYFFVKGPASLKTYINKFVSFSLVSGVPARNLEWYRKKLIFSLTMV